MSLYTLSQFNEGIMCSFGFLICSELIEGMVMNLGKVLCCMFLLAILEVDPALPN